MSQPNEEPQRPRKAVVQHDARLEILCCLSTSQPMTVEQVTDLTGMNERCARYHMCVLEASGLVEQDGGDQCDQEKEEGGPARYVPCLDRHPEWVTASVDAHREAATE